MSDFRREFLAFALACEVLRFGEFTTKAGRKTPYFFNAGLFNDGDSLRTLGRFYARALQASAIACDQLFGPAYKGIALAAATAIALSENGQNLPWSFNRKEAKDHGEGGVVVGAPLRGRVLIVDDVITAGTSVRESVDLIRAHGANPAGVLIALDRMERGQGSESAVQEVRALYGIPVVAIATLDDLMGFLASREDLKAQGDADKTLNMILSRLDDMKAEETVTIDLRGKSAFSDYMIVTTGRANRHVGAIAENVTKALKENGIKSIHVEGLPNCDWVLIDSGDVVVHVFRPEVREFYNLERLWTQNPAAVKAI